MHIPKEVEAIWKAHGFSAPCRWVEPKEDGCSPGDGKLKPKCGWSAIFGISVPVCVMEYDSRDYVKIQGTKQDAKDEREGALNAFQAFLEGVRSRQFGEKKGSHPKALPVGPVVDFKALAAGDAEEVGEEVPF